MQQLLAPSGRSSTWPCSSLSVSQCLSFACLQRSSGATTAFVAEAEFTLKLDLMVRCNCHRLVHFSCLSAH